MTDGEQLQLDLTARCPECGSRRHHHSECRDWYDPEMVKPAMIANVIEQHGWDEATKRLPGLRLWGQQPPADWRPTEAEIQLLKLPDEPTPKQRRKA